VRRYVVSDPRVHDSQNIENVLATSNTAKLAERGLMHLHFFLSTSWRVNFVHHEVAGSCMSCLEGLAILTEAECARVIRKNLHTSQLWRAQGQDPPYARIGKTPVIAAPPWHLKQERLPSAEGRSK
jgi:hypothetical protein